MDNDNVENADSSNGENSFVDDGNTVMGGNVADNAAALREKLAKLEDTNRKLFERAKKAEGFELKGEHWIKTQAPETKSIPPVKADNSDYGMAMKAYLRAEGIKGEQEVELVKSFVSNTGKQLEEVIENKYFQQELKDLREANAAKAAIPEGTRSTDKPVRDTVDYWLAKGEMPPTEQVMLRREYVNALVEKQKQESRFTKQPFVNG